MTEEILYDYQAVRKLTVDLCKPLRIEDYVIQGMSDVSPPKWHLAHTTWFFEEFVLKIFDANYKLFDPGFNQLFNSYYYQLGDPYPRGRRGLLSRPTVEHIYEYRAHVDTYVKNLINNNYPHKAKKISNIIELGINHEQQHQELMLLDIKYNFFLNYTAPVYQELPPQVRAKNYLLVPDFIHCEEVVTQIGNKSKAFCFDNELPLHNKIIAPFAISSALVTNADYIKFIEAGGYKISSYWLADGWNWVKKNSITGPLYWIKNKHNYEQFTLSGIKPLELAQPLCHVSYYEADAYARFVGCRLPSEEEWEYAAQKVHASVLDGIFLESGHFHPQATGDSHNFFGNVWEWTKSSYAAYPGYKPLKDALAEYNGKFMANQMVLRGGSCVTPARHIRASYRNFYYPGQRWFFGGIRLARDS
jgi:ergothioneine biosynthesis protein EgtB